jgi:hypothetical protein
MAKFNVTVELDWVDEEHNLDSDIRDAVIRDIKNKLSEPLLKKINEETGSTIQSQISALALSAINERINAFMTTPRNITNKFGEIEREGVTVEDILKEQLEAAVDKKMLDENGRPTRDNYNKKYSLLEYLVKARTQAVGQLIEERCKKAIEETKGSIERMVTDKVKTQVADKLTNLIVENSTALSLKS